MRCPKCNAEMVRVDVPKLEGGRIFVWVECPKCHFRTQHEHKDSGVGVSL